MIHPYTNHIKMMKAKTENILKAARTKQLIMYNRSKIRLTADPSTNTMEVRRHCKGILKMLKSKGKGLCGLPNSQQNCKSLRIELRFLFSKSTSLILNTMSLISMGIKLIWGTGLKCRFLDCHLRDSHPADLEWVSEICISAYCRSSFDMGGFKITVQDTLG